jgi:CheY-like chemotaxis protein
MDGLTATQIIRAHEKNNNLSHTPIIALTANVLLEDKLEAQNAGMDGFANKPIDVSALTLEMVRVLSLEAIEKEAIETETEEPQAENKKQIHLNKGLGLWGEMSIYLAELNHFFELNKTLTTSLLNHVENKEFDQIISLAHAIKGSSSNLALLEISKQAASIESVANTNNDNACINAIQKLENNIEDFRQELKQLNDAHQIKTTENKNMASVAISSDALLILIEELIELTNAGEVDDIKIDHFVQSVEVNMKGKAIEVKNAILDFEFNKAITTLSCIQNMIKEEV